MKSSALLISRTITEAAKENWQRCFEYLKQQAIEPSTEFCHQVLIVFTLSEFVAKQCGSNPQILHELIISQRLEGCLSYQSMNNGLLTLVSNVETEQQLSIVLRNFRNQQMVAIYWRELLDLASVKETCQQVSMLADICLISTNEWLHLNQCKELQIDFEDNPIDPLIVIGMGKLGGRELNVSSDIDLIFCYEKNAELKTKIITKPKQLNNQAFYNRVARKLIKCLDEVKAEGFVFRVDMRLRPYGESGPLLMSFAALEEYYQDQGRDWERFALIKARAITGSEQAKIKLNALLLPFVYRRYIDYSVLESPRQMKKQINNELRRRNLDDNIKLGPGGIREVEFIAQALQLIYGGKEPTLQCRSLFNSLPRLVELKLLKDSVVEELLNSYLFLRRVEHRLQAAKDQQTQTLPTDESQQLRLAASFGFDRWQGFRVLVKTKMDVVHVHFNLMFDEQAEVKKKSKVAVVYHDIWQEISSDNTDLKALIESASFVDSEEISEQLKKFKTSSAVNKMGPRGIKRLAQLMPVILQLLIKTPNQLESVIRILKLLTAISTRTAYLELLAENIDALEQLIKLCSASARIAEQISDYPYVLDELINPNTLFHPPDIGLFPDLLRQSLCRIPEEDVEQQMDCLREFRHLNLLRVTAADIVGALTLQQLSRYLTAIAETVIEAVVKMAWQQLILKHGNPQTESSSAENAEHFSNLGFAIIAYGKLGGHELGYASDLDLVFLHNALDGKTDGEKPIDNAVFFMRLAQKIIHLLSIRTRSGVLYEVDMRLRPSGNSGLLVSHIEAFTEYQKESAWTWEHQALIRGRCILGSVLLRERFEQIRSSAISRKRDDSKLRTEIVKMREKMRASLLDENLLSQQLFNLKQSQGGIADIEFLTQYLVLKLAAEDSMLTISSNTVELLSFMSQKNKAIEPRLKQLTSVYADLCTLVNNRALQNKGIIISIEQMVEINIGIVIELWTEMLVD